MAHEGSLAQSTSHIFQTWTQFSNYSVFSKSFPEVVEKSHKDIMKIEENALWLDNEKSSKLIKPIIIDTGRS